MIESISLSGIATYSITTPVTMHDLKKINYIFGSNGSGKTTISRVINDVTISEACNVSWKNDNKLETFVYNRDFVNANFKDDLKGIFTVGKESIETLNKISEAKAESFALTIHKNDLYKFLHGDDGKGGKKGELTSLEDGFKDACWKKKKEYEEIFLNAFDGFHSNANNFKKQILLESATNSATLDTLENLKKKSEIIFGPTPEKVSYFSNIATDNIIVHESNHILQKHIIGKADVDIAAMINKLGNSDWVEEGRRYYQANDNTCPFCQQRTSDSLAKSLNEYFDETFVKDCKAISDLENSYHTDAEIIKQQIDSIIAGKNVFLDLKQLNQAKELLDSKITTNIQRIAAKNKEPSQACVLESLANVVVQINTIITAANTLITAHNAMVTNLAQEQKELKKQIWKYLIEKELKADLADYNSQRDLIQKAIDKLNEDIIDTNKKLDAKQDEKVMLEKLTTSIQPTVDEINSYLSSFGFQSFRLEKADHGPFYKLVRSDGTEAKESLSEGEKSFVTFLYFYHLIKGSNSESGTTTDRIVVFDDPVSSLDSDILFIVSSLIRGICQEVRAGTGYIKQVFVFTHNVYFHKEVTFTLLRDEKKTKNNQTFWIVRRQGLDSKIEKYTDNPIKTSYQLLWEEVKKAEPNSLTIPNTLRRILENYFRLFGYEKLDKICEKLSSKEQPICRTLISWIHDGSHYVGDELYVSTIDSAVEGYLKVFKEIFDKTGHLTHYNLMMGIENISESSETSQHDVIDAQTV